MAHGMKHEGLTPSVYLRVLRGSSFLLAAPNSLPAFFRHELLIVGSREQAVQLTRIFECDFNHPRPMGIFVDLFGSRGQLAIYFGHGAGSRSVQIGDRLNRLDRAKRLALGNFSSTLWQIDENDVAERLLRMVRNAHGCVLPIGFNPLVLFGVFEVGWIGHDVAFLCEPSCPSWFKPFLHVCKTVLAQLVL